MPPRTIFIIRHGEKPEPASQNGVDVDGNENDHSLIPRGWQRAGGLVSLFAPFGEQPRTGLAQPTELFSPRYEDATPVHRTYQTILPLSQLIDVAIDLTYDEGHEKKLAEHVSEETTGVTLISWEHTAIPKIAEHIPCASGTVIPGTWPDTRFDMVWSFVYDASEACYVFAQVPQMLLDGDSDTPISS